MLRDGKLFPSTTMSLLALLFTETNRISMTNLLEQDTKDNYPIAKIGRRKLMDVIVGTLLGCNRGHFCVFKACML